MSSAPPPVSVVVATRDRADRLERLLRALAGQMLPAERFEVLVVDDGSTDHTPDVLAHAAAALPIEIRRIDGPDGRGPAAARNRGWRAARGNLIAFTDDDCEPAPDWLQRGLRASEASPGSIVQGRTIPNPDELKRLGPFSRTKRIEEASPWFQTCNIFYPRPLLERLGGFDERFPGAAGEDADLGWRARELGAERSFEQHAVVHHAVEEVGPLGELRQALKGSESARMYRRHPELRARAAYAGIFWNRTHARFALAAVGLALARRFPPAALLALPYAKGLVGRARSTGGSPLLAPYYVLYDCLDIQKTVRGSIRNRVWML
jgi:glycosyltransferase involved in cell wall biosynthesis